jgi:hypothetical protein
MVDEWEDVDNEEDAMLRAGKNNQNAKMSFEMLSKKYADLQRDYGKLKRQHIFSYSFQAHFCILVVSVLPGVQHPLRFLRLPTHRPLSAKLTHSGSVQHSRSFSKLILITRILALPFALH